MTASFCKCIKLSAGLAQTISDMEPVAIFDSFLTALMVPDPDTARRYIAPNLQIVFTGGRGMRDPAECAAFNKGGYKWVKKKFEATELVAGGSPERTVVYNIGTL